MKEGGRRYGLEWKVGGRGGEGGWEEYGLEWKVKGEGERRRNDNFFR